MNIPLCKFIAMPIVRLVLKIDVLKMAYKQGEKVLFVSPTNWQDEKIVDSTIESLWGLFWKEKMIDLKSSCRETYV
jgi:hypothetical protein